MDPITWYKKRDDRATTYGMNPLDPSRKISLYVDDVYARTVAGQAAAIVAVSLLARVSQNITIDIPDVVIDDRLPFAGKAIQKILFKSMYAADPHGLFTIGAFTEGDYAITLGPKGPGRIAHGSGWNAYVGPSPSKLLSSEQGNILGAALAVVLVVAELCVYQFDPPHTQTVMNALNWKMNSVKGPTFVLPSHLGNIWVVGTGSVGSSALYFLSLMTRDFDAGLIDMDHVEVENISRAPIMNADDVNRSKVEVAGNFLSSIGVKNVQIDNCALHESDLWLNRPPNTPDVLISAANEHNVRYHIESGFPSLQIYATTGKNWQANLIRHSPNHGACSCCLFPPDQTQAITKCATMSLDSRKPDDDENDAALPFLSYAAGLMVAAEICKLELVGHPFSLERVTLNTLQQPNLVQSKINPRPGCVCSQRNETVNEKMNRGARYVV
jgi:molybdopterin/thiamine biosynthesis adenylyltransferase